MMTFVLVLLFSVSVFCLADANDAATVMQVCVCVCARACAGLCVCARPLLCRCACMRAFACARVCFVCARVRFCACVRGRERKEIGNFEL